MEPARRVKALIEPGVMALGYELLGVEYRAGGNSALLRVYIDSEQGIGVSDCERVSYQVSGVLDVEDPIASAYDLEVSSPGLDRPLFDLHHFERHCGEEVKVRLSQPMDGRRSYRGVLAGCRDGKVLLRDRDAEHALPFHWIGSARLIPAAAMPSKPNKQQKPHRSDNKTRNR